MTTTAETPGAPAVKSGSREKLTAEERLLQVIENGETPLLKRGDSGDVLRWFKKFHFSFHLASVNRILILLSALGLIGVVANTFFFKPDIQRVYNRVAQANVGTSRPVAIASRRPVDEYLNAITRKDIFQPDLNSAGRPTDAPALPKTSIEEVLSNLQLVGIAWGVYPEAMLRDKKKGRTYFVKQGDSFEKVLVKEILKDRVIVEYGGQSKELM